MTNYATRGKALEDAYKTICDEYEKSAKFSAHRFPDARAGSRVTAPADRMSMLDGKTFFVELKEVAFDARLPYENFKSDQVARMRKWQLAGATAKVLIHHTSAGIYRVLPVDYFVERPAGKASWFFKDDGEKFTDLLDAFKYIHRI